MFPFPCFSLSQKRPPLQRLVVVPSTHRLARGKKEPNTAANSGVDLLRCEVTLSDLKPLSFLGAGAFSTVRLVEHRRARVARR